MGQKYTKTFRKVLTYFTVPIIKSTLPLVPYSINSKITHKNTYITKFHMVVGCVYLLLAPEWIHILHDSRKRFCKGKNYKKKKVLRLSPGEGSYCSLETKNDRKKAPRAKLLVSNRRLQTQKSQP
jgi:hypothetical protein